MRRLLPRTFSLDVRLTHSTFVLFFGQTKSETLLYNARHTRTHTLLRWRALQQQDKSATPGRAVSTDHKRVRTAGPVCRLELTTNLSSPLILWRAVSCAHSARDARRARDIAAHVIAVPRRTFTLACALQVHVCAVHDSRVCTCARRTPPSRCRFAGEGEVRFRFVSREFVPCERRLNSRPRVRDR